MKKLTILLASMLTAVAGFAQTEHTTPNRILVTNTAGDYKGFVIDYLDDISFARVDGEVLAKVEINEVTLDSLKLTVTRTPDCQYYKLAVIPKVTADQLTNDVTAIRYINSLPSSFVPTLWEDFDNGLLTGVELNPESDYALYTIGVDRYGVEAGVFKADFTTPTPVITGNPHVGMETVASTLNSFTVSFTPNEDVQTYWILAGEKGTMEQQYEMFGPMFNFANFSQMIQMWGIQCVGNYEYEWTDMAPNTEYEVFVAMTDVNGYFAPYEVYETSTVALGGHGDAYVDIDINAYELSDWYGEMLPTQSILFYPNDEASCYRYGVYPASTYDESSEALKEELCSDPFMPMSYWFFYEPMESEFQIDPSTECVVIAAAKNIDGVWGEVNVVRFTTPDECEGYVPAETPARKGIAPRMSSQKKATNFSKGVMPNLNMPVNKVELK
ncbi:MAG: hypothetical protein HDR88_06495 [Bacteroides sp.]|nr:hypothetical protein [Bacteroides sp.]